MRTRRFLILALAAAVLLFVCAGCAPGTERYETSQAGFWAGLWHGLIMIITFIIGLFAENVRMYEPSNIGPLYDLGFILGAIVTLGGCASNKCRRGKVRKQKEWEDVEKEVKAGIQSWLAESDSPEGEWEDIAHKVEEKIKRELRNWAEE